MRMGFNLKYHGEINKIGIEMYSLLLAIMRHLCILTTQCQWCYEGKDIKSLIIRQKRQIVSRDEKKTNNFVFDVVVKNEAS